MMLGADYTGNDTCTFTVWVPGAQQVSVRILGPSEHELPLHPLEKGYWKISADGIRPGSRYMYRLNGSTERPDPASGFQPEGVHGPSAVVDHASFAWTDASWKSIAPEDMILYELHVGTFTPEGTFEAAIGRLDDLRALGITAVELMPVAQFPGARNWGYDGVYPFAVQNSCGGPEGLRKLVDACHARQIAVVLDVVYNHLGPEGNYLHDFGPYFTDKYRTPWGKAVNFDDACSDGVRDYFIENALFWFQHYHIDALRLDALHAIYDMSAKPFLQELAEKTKAFSDAAGRRFTLIGESDLNDIKLIQPPQAGGYGLDGQWCDDFHHSLHTLLTGEKNGYYADFGRINNLVKSLREGFVYSGEYSTFRKRRHGNSSKEIPARRFVVFSQNHDQVGNRMLGERLSALVPFEGLKLAAGAVLFSPYVPLLFMGQEYGETAPFLYFVSHTDPDLVEAVRRGRQSEFEAFGWQGKVPDPQAEETFERSKLNWEKRQANEHKQLLAFYTHLIRIRKQTPALSHLSKEHLEVQTIENTNLIVLRRRKDDSRVVCFLNFENRPCRFVPEIPEGEWSKLIDSAQAQWGGSGSQLPSVIEPGMELIMPALGFAVFQSTGGSGRKEG